MAAGLVTLLALLLLAWPGVPAEAQRLGPVFKRVNPSVVVIRTKEREVAGRGQGQTVRISQVGSGVLVRQDGKVITAAHLVQTADEIKVEFLGGEVVWAGVIASEPEADVARLP